MEWECPETLCDLCLDQVCLNLERLCSERADGSLLLSSASVLPREIADQLLHKMSSEGIVNDKTIGIFRQHKELRLSRACLRRCLVSAEAFRLAVCPHRLREVDASWARGDISGAQIISDLASNPKCRSSLWKLSLNGLCLDWAALADSGNNLRSLKGLRMLSLAGTDLNDAVLEDVCSLPQLESLDISCTAVSKLTALLRCKTTLRCLTAHCLRQLESTADALFSVLVQLDALRHLDLSDDHFIAQDGDRSDGDAVLYLLRVGPEVLPSLVSLDLSGRRRMNEAAVAAFVEARKELVFLGLLATGICACPALSAQKNLKVTGQAHEKQLCEALRRYGDRVCFTREALYHLYILTTDSQKPQTEILELVVKSMQSHPTSLLIHLLATACVFNLTALDQAKALPVGLLCYTVTQLLRSMKTFHQHTQVQKNCLLALCSNYILQNISFDTYLAATLVINWLSSYKDPTLQRMAVAVISILVDKLSTAEVAKLGEDIYIMKQLLAIVQQRAMLGVVDSTLKFALSVLWNLTDEMSVAARNFIQCNGLELYEEILESYYTEPSIQWKVLGLLNNIAEVEELQRELMVADLLEHIVRLLQDTKVVMEVRYFAGGILAHLTSRPEAWILDEKLRSHILEELHVSIAAWTHLENEIVVYRSLRPFCHLLGTCQPTGVQLWAVWAIHFVTTQDALHYSWMLEQEGVTEHLKALASHPDSHTIIRGLSESILFLLESHKGAESHSSWQKGNQSRNCFC
ncbi:protein zyg-11 homolog isoform X2 [Syngnathus scovelli]|uniref:protein zyg-11 homolog isoform X2 n=1 Tax=Syngnathus scovelli TaxID=161590 RepID=UPI00210F27EE|nr:protein zyg-11 homolog isoform X2 [Syngnathus scovelli]